MYTYNKIKFIENYLIKFSSFYRILIFIITSEKLMIYFNENEFAIGINLNN